VAASQFFLLREHRKDCKEVGMNAPTGFPALEAALQFFSGSQSALAAAIGLKQQSVNDVFRAQRPAPAKWCIALEKATKGAVTRHQLRPDLYPEHEAAQ
jgi:DNA-binding transcriptional regulator YdaS (Cro superfamily)